MQMRCVKLLRLASKLEALYKWLRGHPLLNHLSNGVFRQAASTWLLLFMHCSKPVEGTDGAELKRALQQLQDHVLDEEQTLQYRLPSGEALVQLEGLPPGAVYVRKTQTLSFTPDFIQGSDREWKVDVTLKKGRSRAQGSFFIRVRDTIAPPWPRVRRQVQTKKGYRRLELSQVTDPYLERPSKVGRSHVAVVAVPSDAGSYPIGIYLHGAQSKPLKDGNKNEIQIHPSDPADSYWWGYAERLPPRGHVVNYTQRRVLHLLEWVLQGCPDQERQLCVGADPNRVYLYGKSMGASGAMTLGLLYARHFCWVYAEHGQPIPLHHRAYRVRKLSELWGEPDRLEDFSGTSPWRRQDIVAAMDGANPYSVHEARDQFLTLKYGQKDAVISFSGLTAESPESGRSLIATLQEEGIGHQLAWDQATHTKSDAALPERWWQKRHPIFDTPARLERRVPFPALSEASAVDAMAALEATSGALNGAFVWDATRTEETRSFLQFRLRAELEDAQKALVVTVTPRRMQQFHPEPGELVKWSFGKDEGVVQVAQDQTLSVANLMVTTEWQTLHLERQEHRPYFRRVYPKR